MAKIISITMAVILFIGAFVLWLILWLISNRQNKNKGGD